MHSSAYSFLLDHQELVHFRNKPGKGLDLGGRIANDNPRVIWLDCEWTAVDIANDNGQGLARPKTTYIKDDACTWEPTSYYDLVLCTEVLEHVEEWDNICETAFRSLYNEGTFFVTCAGPGRKPHNMHTGGILGIGEWYENILPHVLGHTLRQIGFRCKITYDPHHGDLYAYAIKP